VIVAASSECFPQLSLDGVLQRLEHAGVRYRAVDIAGTPIRQINIRDLNGVNIELNYRPSAA